MAVEDLVALMTPENRIKLAPVHQLFICPITNEIASFVSHAYICIPNEESDEDHPYFPSLSHWP